WGILRRTLDLMSNQRGSAFSWFVLATCSVYAGFFIFAIYTTVRYHGWVKDGGWNERHDARGSYVSTVNERGAAARRLEPGDRLVAFNGGEGRAVLGIYQWRDIERTIGVMVVETVTGTRPFAGQTPEQVLTALLRSEYHLPGASPEIRALDAIVRQCLAKDPRDRYGSAAELPRALVPPLAPCRRRHAPPAR